MLDIIIFGGIGDLSLRKLLPSFYHLYRDDNLPADFSILCVSRSDEKRDDFLNLIKSKLEKFLGRYFDENIWNRFKDHLHYDKIDFMKDEGWDGLKSHVIPNDNENIRNVIYYLSVSPTLFAPICEKLNEHQLNPEYSKVVVEKPLGEDYESAAEINNILTSSFSEEQIYRIDHYLGKDAVQNILHLRFSNYLMEAVWDKEHIESVEILVAETIGVEGRAEFFDRAGILRDMVQNHLMQILTYLTMEAPKSLSASDIHDEKLKIIEALSPIDDDNVAERTIRAQYTAGEVAGENVPGYKQEINNAKTQVSGNGETYVALKVMIDNERWQGVPFYLRTGKRLSRRVAEVRVSFKAPSNNLYPSESKNQLIIEIQPELTVSIDMLMKLLLGEDAQLNSHRHQMDLKGSTSEKDRIPEAYERLLLEVIKGNQTYFVRDDEIRASWKWIDAIRKAWSMTNQKMEEYPAGSKGLKIK